MNTNEYLFTSESVTEGHPDKICDQISDAILDAILEREAELEQMHYVSKHGEAASVDRVRCAIETLVSTGTIIISGELRCQAYVDLEQIARSVVRDIGYDRAKYGFDCDTCGVLTMVHAQSADIAAGVDSSYEAQRSPEQELDPLDLIGAGDQGMMFGYAVNETKELMPLPIALAHRLARGLSALRKEAKLGYLRPDGKTQVSVRYVDDKPVAIETILISTQHDAEIDDMDVIKHDLIEKLIEPTLAEYLKGKEVDYSNVRILVNPTGRFVTGGPMGDTGLTGRKIIVDTYGGFGRHGGGAFSGKDCTKVDRSGAYAARWVAKNIVAAGLAHRCEVQLAYAIGLAHPLSIMIDTHGTERCDISKLEQAVQEVFDLRPGAIIQELELNKPQFRASAAYGHFGREDQDFAWERCNKVEQLKEALARME